MNFRLVSFDLCPFVQRSTIALEEKGVDYDIEYIDLSDKPDWFLKISPHGKVPVLEVTGEESAVLFESTVILEFLDEIEAPQLHPDSPLAKARDRAWFSVSDALNGAVFRAMIAADEEALKTQAEAIKAQLAKLEPELVGPLWRGEGFSAMDAVIYPGLQRCAWLQALYPELELFAGVPKVKAWEQALRERPSIKASTVPDIHARFVKSLPAYGAVHKERLG